MAFAEKLLRRSGGGAVGVFGWTRMSNTMYYRALIEGTLGALWPGTLPSYGDGSVKSRLGDLFNFSKIYMAYKHASWNPNASDGPNTLNHVRLYHFFGDPTLEARTDDPYELPHDIVLIPLPDYLHINYAEEGALITRVAGLAGRRGADRPRHRARRRRAAQLRRGPRFQPADQRVRHQTKRDRPFVHGQRATVKPAVRRRGGRCSVRLQADLVKSGAFGQWPSGL